MHPKRTLSYFLLVLVVSASTPPSLFSQTLKISAVRLWNSEKREFTPPGTLTVHQGKISSWVPASEKESKSKELVQYALPSFCDASVTLGSQSFGQTRTLSRIPQSLQAHLRSGFGHILSVGDGEGMDKLRLEIEKGSRLGPQIVLSGKAFVPKNPFPAIPESRRFQVLSEEDQDCHFGTTKDSFLPFFLKKQGESYLVSRQLFSCFKKMEEHGNKPLVFTFAEESAWEEALQSGALYLFHAMPPTVLNSDLRLRKIHWAPLFSVSYYESLRENPQLLGKVLDQLASRVGSFGWEKTDWNVSQLPQDLEKAETKKGEWARLSRSFYQRKIFQDKWIFGSGSGFWGLLPGLSAVQEVFFWEEYLGKNLPDSETLSGEEDLEAPPFWQFWKTKTLAWDLQSPKSDPESIPEVRKQILKILTENTCQFLGAEHQGKIQVGGPAYFLVYSKNPLQTKGGIFEIESVVNRGKLVYTQEKGKKGKTK